MKLYELEIDEGGETEFEAKNMREAKKIARRLLHFTVREKEKEED